MKTPLLMAAIAAGLTLAATAEAREGRDARMAFPTFEELDLDTDGGVTMEEVQAGLQAAGQARFAEIDTNGDGGLSAEEMAAQANEERQARMAERIAERIEKADTNGDGMLQIEELVEARDGRSRSDRGLERMFERFDANEDGILSAEEYAEAAERIQERGRNKR